jgi:hypothetical protein
MVTSAGAGAGARTILGLLTNIANVLLLKGGLNLSILVMPPSILLSTTSF